MTVATAFSAARTLALVGAWVCAASVSAQPAAAAPIRVVDDTGHTVVLPRPAARIVSVAPHLTELLFAAGAGKQVVGTVAYSDHPPAAQRIERVGDSAQLDLERIVALKPDLIVLWQDGTSAQQVEQLARLGLPVFASRARTLADIGHTLRKLGTLAGTGAAADARAAAYDAQLNALQARYAGRAELKVFYQIWHRPLMTVNGAHPISQALALCGARNVFADLNALTPTIAEEAVPRADPDAIVTGSAGHHGPDNLDVWRRMDRLRATRNGHLLVVNPDTLHRQSDRIVDGVLELCEKLDVVRTTIARQPR